MKAIHLILMIFAAAISFGQYPAKMSSRCTPYIQVGDTTFFGQRTGVWRTMDEEGVLVGNTEYQAYEDSYKLKTLEDYFYNAPASGKDTIVYKYKALWSEGYEYDAKGVLLLTKVHDHEQDEHYVLHGENRSLRSSGEKVKRMGAVGTTRTFVLEFENMGNSAVEFNYRDDNGCIDIESIMIPAGDKGELRGEILIQPGRNTFDISIDAGSVEIPLSIETYGYHIMSGVIEESSTVEVASYLHYYRRGYEALINIIDIETNEVVLRAPLNQITCEIDLQSLAPKKYTCEVINYTEDKRTSFFIQVNEP